VWCWITARSVNIYVSSFWCPVPVREPATKNEPRTSDGWEQALHHHTVLRLVESLSLVDKDESRLYKKPAFRESILMVRTAARVNEWNYLEVPNFRILKAYGHRSLGYSRKNFLVFAAATKQFSCKWRLNLVFINPKSACLLHGLTVLDDETVEWLLNTCPEI